ncbi:MAG: redox-regulated ATPase YchF [Oscillospiraceae bacterium]|nr:redox-regulated ATPase YchF [Oscillospiraceae bacterium]
MKLGIIGLPNVGKSTLFNAITNAGAESANYPFCTIEPNVGMVAVPDSRLDFLVKMQKPEKFTPAVIEFVDIAGLVKGASKGEGLGNKFLEHIRHVDAVIHVVRCFDDDNIIHVDGNVDPLRDIEIINTELIYSDIEIVERRIERAKKLVKGDKAFEMELQMFERLLATLDKGSSARGVDFNSLELDILKDTPLLSMKPIIYAANISDNDVGTDIDSNAYYNQVKAHAKTENAEIMPICASIEAEISELETDEKNAFLEEMGIAESGLDKLIKSSYNLLGLISFLTGGPKEARAWTIKAGTKAPQAAGKIHTDFEKGFIRAEVIAFNDLVECGNMVAAKEKGLIRSEGKEYVIKDGDVVLFRFNV